MVPEEHAGQESTRQQRGNQAVLISFQTVRKFTTMTAAGAGSLENVRLEDRDQVGSAASPAHAELAQPTASRP